MRWVHNNCVLVRRLIRVGRVVLVVDDLLVLMMVVLLQQHLLLVLLLHNPMVVHHAVLVQTVLHVILLQIATVITAVAHCHSLPVPAASTAAHLITHMHLDVIVQCRRLSELLLAQGTLERFLARVYLHVVGERGQLPELFATVGASKGFLARVDLHVIGQGRGLPEVPGAVVAFKWFLARVDLHVVGQRGQLSELLLADVALKRFLAALSRRLAQWLPVFPDQLLLLFDDGLGVLHLDLLHHQELVHGSIRRWVRWDVDYMLCGVSVTLWYSLQLDSGWSIIVVEQLY